MPTYKKRPIIIEAFQMTEKQRMQNSEWPEWLHKAWNKKPYETGSVYPTDYPKGNDKLKINTLEGPLLIEWNDYIIQGIKGELYPCKPDIFEASYEEVF